MSTIMVNIAQIRVATPEDKLCALGLGSCVGVVLYDSGAKVAAMLHVLLPETDVLGRKDRTKYADPGIRDLVDAVVQAGAKRANLQAKIAGGASVLASGVGMGIGQKNGEVCQRVLKELNIKIAAKDLGGTSGRSVTFDPETGIMYIRKLLGGESKI